MTGVSEKYHGLFAQLADAMVERRRHLKLPPRSLRGVARYVDGPMLTAFLAELVEARTDGQLTVRSPERGLMYGYVQGNGFEAVLCLAGTPEGLVSDPSLVLQAWICTESNLMPLAFDRMPEDALEGL